MMLEKRRWGPRERWQLMGLLERGYSDADVGAVFGVTEDAIQKARRRYGIPAASDLGWSGAKFAAALGICRQTAYRLIRARAVRAIRTRWGQFLIPREAVLDFVADPAWWGTWEPENVSDPWLSDYVRRVRPPGQYLTSEQAAERLCVSTQTVLKWADQGVLPSIQAGHHGSRVLIPAWAVEQFQRPYEARSAAARRAIDRLRAAGLTYAAICQVIRRCPSTHPHLSRIHRGIVYPGEEIVAALEAALVLLPYYPSLRPALPPPRP